MSKPPYEVSETGWGEFEIQIRIYFNDLTEKPVTLYHGLKLFHTNEAITSQAMIQVWKQILQMGWSWFENNLKITWKKFHHRNRVQNVEWNGIKQLRRLQVKS